jgi:hypothetical protein
VSWDRDKRFANSQFDKTVDSQATLAPAKPLKVNCSCDTLNGDGTVEPRISRFVDFTYPARA